MTIAGEGYTPLPWLLDESRPGLIYCDDRTGSLVARCAGAGFEFVRRYHGEQEANARLIVTAVNALPKLVEALEAITGSTDGFYTVAMPKALRDKAREALASLQSKDTDNV